MRSRFVIVVMFGLVGLVGCGGDDDAARCGGVTMSDVRSTDSDEDFALPPPRLEDVLDDAVLVIDAKVREGGPYEGCVPLENVEVLRYVETEGLERPVDGADLEVVANVGGVLRPEMSDSGVFALGFEDGQLVSLDRGAPNGRRAYERITAGLSRHEPGPTEEEFRDLFEESETVATVEFEPLTEATARVSLVRRIYKGHLDVGSIIERTYTTDEPGGPWTFTADGLTPQQSIGVLFLGPPDRPGHYTIDLPWSPQNGQSAQRPILQEEWEAFAIDPNE
ncbi:MAG: hypothetical protein ACT4OX_11510 [Actinomycetota bacterium]